MAYTLTIPVSLGSSKAGLTLEAQLVDVNGLDLGAPVAAGFVELGQGHYLFTHAGFPQSFRGAVKFYEANNPANVLAIEGANPEWAERLDAAVTSRMAPTSDVDGLTVQTLLEALLAYIAGRSELTDHGDGTRSIVHHRQDAATPKLSITFNADGEFLSTTVS